MLFYPKWAETPSPILKKLGLNNIVNIWWRPLSKFFFTFQPNCNQVWYISAESLMPLCQSDLSITINTWLTLISLKHLRCFD